MANDDIRLARGEEVDALMEQVDTFKTSLDEIFEMLENIDKQLIRLENKIGGWG